MTRATVLSKANVEVDSPFTLTVGVLMDGKQRTIAMMGKQARDLFESIYPKAVLELVGHECPHQSFLRKEHLFLVDSCKIVQE
jgi:hypothetical protein